MLAVGTRGGTIALKDDNVILRVDDLRKYFPIKKGLFKRVVGNVKAVDGISFFVRKGETVGVVGESGCGKTTAGRCIVRVMEPTSGQVQFRRGGQMVDLLALSKHEMKKARQEIQMIFQDPFSSLDPRMTVKKIIAEPLDIHKIGTRQEQEERVKELMSHVGLGAYQLERYPHEFSGGQRQRIGIARALALNPSFIVCDEPVSALDVSVQAQVINLLSDLQEQFDLTYLFIAHDLSVVEHVSDRIMVMYVGQVVEMTTSKSLYTNPKHPYTEALLQAIPIADPRSRRDFRPLEGNVPDPSNPPPGCKFHTRCPYVQDICKREPPELRELKGMHDHFVACHRAEELELQGIQSRTAMSRSS